ncbi:glycosyltransferase [Candidatus Pelagibacter bacterium nBUS_44]|uniref:glycosyltransferase n=1 Tax=Candidatus Pelagibacter bacterium nBUS_44 TaxID=3374195 RepID=UPI003EBF3884
MAKYNLSKKTRVSNLLICILYHDVKTDLLSLIKNINLNKNISILIVVDGKKKIKNKELILKLNKRIKFLYSLQKKTVAHNRNLGLLHAKNKFDTILYIDSDVIPEKKIANYHLNFHSKNKLISIIGGPVIPSFFKNNFNIWEVLDGCLSWFTSIKPNFKRNIDRPYHLPTCNLSIKMNFLIDNQIFFDEKLETGEDVDLCNKVREKNGKIMLINKAKVYHQDRKNFKDFFNHHAKWGRHQYYTLYKKKFFHLTGRIIFYSFFLIFYPIFMPIINLISTLLTIFPWVKSNIKFIFLLLPTYIVHLIKGFFTYFEFLKDLMNTKNK